MPLNWDDETRRLEASLGHRLDAFGPDLRAASDRLLQRSGIGVDARPLWTARFRPLTLLYPLLQAEAFAECVSPAPPRAASDLGSGSAPGPDVLRPLGLAHLMVLLHAFLDDRRRDGQIELDSAESALCDRLLADARDLIDATFSDSAPGLAARAAARRAADELLRDYEAAQAACYPPAAASTLASAPDAATASPSLPGAPVPPAPDILEPEVARIVAGRAAHGFIATAALLAHVRCDPATAARLREAFDRVVVALQWVDDTTDAVEDLLAGDENLLLRLLAARAADPGAPAPPPAPSPSPPGASADPSSDASPERQAEPHGEPQPELILLDLIRAGLVDLALDQALRLYREAMGIQEDLGAAGLVRAIALHLAPIEQIRRDLRRLADLFPA